MSKKSVVHPVPPDAMPDDRVIPPAADTGTTGAKNTKSVAPHIELTAENIGKPQPGKTFVDSNGNVRADH